MLCHHVKDAKDPIAERVEPQDVNNPARNLAERQLDSVTQRDLADVQIRGGANHREG